MASCIIHLTYQLCFTACHAHCRECHPSDIVKCYNCQDVHQGGPNCTSLVGCDTTTQACSVTLSSTRVDGYNLGCTSKALCNMLTTLPGADPAVNCCNTSMCNIAPHMDPPKAQTLGCSYIDCYSCSDVHDGCNNCTNTVSCDTTVDTCAVTLSQKWTNRFELGCINKKTCEYMTSLSETDPNVKCCDAPLCNTAPVKDSQTNTGGCDYLECYDCVNVYEGGENCSSKVHCDPKHEVCSVSLSGKFAYAYNLGCLSKTTCDLMTSLPGARPEVRCCNTSLCNVVPPAPILTTGSTTCVDTSYCATMVYVGYPVCTDDLLAKTDCKRTCNRC